MKRKMSRVAPLVLALVAAFALALPAFAADPQFKQPVFYKAGPGPFEVITADFDEDGTLDLMTANRFGGEQPGTGDLSYLKGNSDGTFQAARQYEVSTSATDVIAEDFDEDGDLDVALTDPDTGPAGSPGSVVILLGDGSGNFERTPARSDETESGGIRPFELVAADFDGDRDKDIAVANGGPAAGGGTVGIIANSGAGNFTFDTALTPDPLQSVESLDVGEFDEDGDPDIVATLSDAVTGDADDAYIYLGDAGRAFTPATPPTVPVGDAPVHAFTDDFDGDGNQDFATANNGSDDVSVVLGNGDGTFATAEQYATEEGPYALTTADFNRDGDLDIAAANQFTRSGGGPGNDQGTVSVLPGRGDGTFEDQVVRDTGDGPVGVTSGFFNNDLIPDLSTANYGAGGPERETDTVAVLLGEPVPPDCSDNEDNDGDGNTDFPDDPGCESDTDTSESPDPPPACSDGRDNDNDGRTDFPNDPGCTSNADDSESPNPPPTADLALSINDNRDQVDSGSRVIYTIRVANNSNTNDVENVKVRFEIARGTEFSPSDPEGCRPPRGRTVTCSFRSIDSNDSESIRIGVKVNRNSDFEVRGRISDSNANDPNGTNDSDSERTRVR